MIKVFFNNVERVHRAVRYHNLHFFSPCTNRILQQEWHTLQKGTLKVRNTHLECSLIGTNFLAYSCVSHSNVMVDNSHQSNCDIPDTHQETSFHSYTWFESFIHLDSSTEFNYSLPTR